MWGDAAKLRSVVDNLLGNAVKFAPRGGEIRIRARESAGLVTIDVLDSGPGVPLEEREAIFEAFYRGRAGHSGAPRVPVSGWPSRASSPKPMAAGSRS